MEHISGRDRTTAAGVSLLVMLSATIPMGAVFPGAAAAQREPAAAERDTQRRQVPASGPVEVQVGAGTTAGTTNGASQALAHNGQERKPPLPQAKLCDAYRGETREHCLEVVLRGDRESAAQGQPGQPAADRARSAE